MAAFIVLLRDLGTLALELLLELAGRLVPSSLPQTPELEEPYAILLRLLQGGETGRSTKLLQLGSLEVALARLR